MSTLCRFVHQVGSLRRCRSRGASLCVVISSVAMFSSLAAAQPHGRVDWWGGPIANIPDCWLHCDGRELQRADYPLLFQAIGTIYGSRNS